MSRIKFKMEPKKIKCKFCGQMVFESQIDHWIGVCPECLKKVMEEEKENDNAKQ